MRHRLPIVSAEKRQFARHLRKEMTIAERRLWNLLRSGQMGVKFYRQRVVGEYICDFLAPEVGLVVEVDGSQHYDEEGKNHDLIRDNYLKSIGLVVLRFSDRDVMLNLEGVGNAIIQEIAKLRLR